MCQKLDGLTPNKQRKIDLGSTRKIDYVLFENIHFINNQNQHVSLLDHINKIAIKHWESKFEYDLIQLKNLVLTSRKNLLLVFKNEKFNAIPSLFPLKTITKRTLSMNEVGYHNILN